MKRNLPIISLFLFAALVMSACGPQSESPTPTEVSVEAIQTMAAATIYAAQTGTASAMPTATSTSTDTPVPSATFTPEATSTRLPTIPPKPVFTAAITTTGTPGTLMPSITPTLGGVGCNNLAFVQDVKIPDNTKLSPNEPFTKIWRVKNTGTCAWTLNYKITFIGGELFGSDTTKLRHIVDPGATFDIALNMVAPGTAGKYTSTWRMATDTGTLFGSQFSVVIVVDAPAATATSGAAYYP